jgi:putative ABC transport system substrate-binding protein
MNRREFVSSLGMAAIAWPGGARAQTAGKIVKVGMLWHAGSADEEGIYFTSLIRGFEELGYLQGRSISLEHRYAHERYERFPALAKELVELKMDVIMASILPAARAAKEATSTIPVVFVIVADPVGSGLAKSLAHPGGNLTGMSNVTEDLTAKRVQMFKEAVPAMRRMGLIVHPGGQSPPRVFEEYRAAAASLGIETVVLEAHSPEEIDGVMEGAGEQRLDAVASAPDSMLFNARQRIAERALKYRLPYMGANLDTAAAGGLLEYGPDHAEIFRASTKVVDKILHGESPADIPIQQPVIFHLRLNLQTASKLGLTIAPELLARADQVIE